MSVQPTLLQTLDVSAGQCNTDSVNWRLLLRSFGVFKVGLKVRVPFSKRIECLEYIMTPPPSNPFGHGNVLQVIY